MVIDDVAEIINQSYIDGFNLGLKSSKHDYDLLKDTIKLLIIQHEMNFSECKDEFDRLEILGELRALRTVYGLLDNEQLKMINKKILEGFDEGKKTADGKG